MSPLLFALYVADLGEAITNSTDGFELNGKFIFGLFLADDLVLVAKKTSRPQKPAGMHTKMVYFQRSEYVPKKSHVISPADKNWDIFGVHGE